jgi:hypothetical protein
MTANLDTQVRYPTTIEPTEAKEARMIRILDDADLDAVNGGTSNFHDVVVRAALGVLFDRAWAGYSTGAITESLGPCNWK